MSKQILYKVLYRDPEDHGFVKTDKWFANREAAEQYIKQAPRMVGSLGLEFFIEEKVFEELS
jgi:hypothetical protein